jgi:glycerophosphoryl diester phosphodiesterase
VVASSFFDSNLKKAEQLVPEVPRGLLAREGWLGVWARSFGFAFGNYAALHLHRRNANPMQVQRVHRLRRRIHVWTVNQAEEISRLHSWGIDGIFTDDPPLALSSIGRRG